MDKIHFVIIAVVKLAITLLAMAIVLDTAIVPLMVSASQQIAANSYAIHEMMKNLLMLTIVVCAIVLTFKSHKNNTGEGIRIIKAEESTLLKVAYFYNNETLEEAVKEASIVGISVNFIGTGKETLGNEEHPFVLFCDENNIGTEFFMQNGALKCAHFCTGAIA